MKLIFIFLSAFLCFLSSSKPEEISDISPFYAYEIPKALFLVAAGTWLAQKQIPRILGTQVEFNAPIFTKILASAFFAVGTAGCANGVYILGNAIHRYLQEKQKQGEECP